jgi:hypothetical protein
MVPPSRPPSRPPPPGPPPLPPSRPPGPPPARANATDEALEQRLRDAERVNAELLRLARITGAGAWKSPIVVLALLAAFGSAALVGSYVVHRRMERAARAGQLD